jgi:hypothetical protein
VAIVSLQSSWFSELHVKTVTQTCRKVRAFASH